MGSALLFTSLFSGMSGVAYADGFADGMAADGDWTAATAAATAGDAGGGDFGGGDFGGGDFGGGDFGGFGGGDF